MNKGVVGEPFEKYVFDQISNRQKLQGKGLDSKRTTEDINYLNNRNAWVKLASSVLVEDTSIDGSNVENGKQRLIDLGVSDPEVYMNDELAKRFILFNGTQELHKNGNATSYTVREGIAKTKESLNNIFSPNAYGLGGSNQGIQPMPGIESVNVECVNRGSIRKATVNLKVYNKVQFHIIELLYLRLGFSMLLEWGWDKYLYQDEKNNVSVENMGNTLTENFWFNDVTCNDITQSQIIEEIEVYRRKYQGNYDGFYGKVVNYSWNFNKDGSYDITLDLITVGDVIESLKINTPSNLNLYPSKNEEGEEVELDGEFEGFEGSNIIDVAGANAIGEFLYNQIKSFSNSVDFYKLDGKFASIDQENDIGTQWFYKYAKFSEEPQYKYYVRFGRLLEFIETDILPSISNTENNVGEVICSIDNSISSKYKNFPNQISINPKVCLIPPNIKGYEYDDLEIGLIKDKSGENVSLIDLFHKTMLGGNNVTYYQKGVGTITDIYLNFEFVASQLSQNLDKDENLFLYKFLEGICNGINNALGSVNKIQPIIDEDKRVKFIDESLSFDEVYPEEAKKTKEVELEIYGYNQKSKTSNFVKDISFQTKLGPEIATTISIGATAEGNNTKTVDGTSFSKWNDGLKDKFNRFVSSPPNRKNTSERERQRQKQELAKHFDANSGFFDINTPALALNFAASKLGILKGKAAYNITYEISYKNKTFLAASKESFIAQGLKHLQEIKNNDGVLLDEDGLPTQIPTWDFYLSNSLGGKINQTLYLKNNRVGKAQTKNRFTDEDIRYFELNDGFISNGIQLYKEYIKTYYQKIYNKIQQASGTIGFIPITLDITAEGISGIKIYQKLNIRQEFLPPQYPKALKFLITKVNHEISGNNWNTKLGTITTSNIDHEEVIKYEKEYLKQSKSSDFNFVNTYSEDNKNRINPRNLKIDTRGLEEIKKWEAFRDKAYDDLNPNTKLTANTPIEGELTVGYGFTKNIIPDLKWDTTLNEVEASNILNEKITLYEDIVRSQIKVDLTQNEFNALVSIVYNSGELGNTSNGKPTPLLENLNKGKYFEASEIIPQYRLTSGGKILNGLINRRKSEQNLFLSDEFRST